MDGPAGAEPSAGLGVRTASRWRESAGHHHVYVLLALLPVVLLALTGLVAWLVS